jgi:dTMP kinase
MQARRGAIDRFEVETAQFFDRVRNRYLELARAEPARFRVIDATQDLEKVRESALAALELALGIAPMPAR